MLNVTTSLIFFLNFSIITIILWAVTLLEAYTNKNTQHFSKTTVYECGFWTINKNVFPISLNTLLILLFVIIYEVEFILIIPLSLNILNFNNIGILSTLLIVYFIIITLLVDINLKKINWVF